MTLHGRPNPRQAEFFACTQRYVAYGGARGGGKSWALRRKLILMCCRYAGLRVLLLRRTLPELRENHLLPLQGELQGIARWSETRRDFTFPNGSRLRLGYCDGEGDVFQYQGQEYDVIGVDEATSLTELQFATLTACLRGVNGLPKRMLLTCNPGGVGHAWVKRLFVDRRFRPEENPDDYAFVPAKVFDNTVLLERDPDYVRRLEALPPDLRAAWLDGSWELFAGQFFPEFARRTHVCAPVDVPPHWRRMAALDYGLDRLALVVGAVDTQGRLWICDEVCESGLIVSQAAEVMRPHLAGVDRILAPSDLWSRQKDSGKSMAQLFADCGIFLERHVPQRVAGWMALREWLRPVEDEAGGLSPRLRIFPQCKELIHCLERLQADPQRPGDAALRPHELTHAPDALRYLASAWPAPSPVPKPVRKRTLRDRLRAG